MLPLVTHVITIGYSASMISEFNKYRSVKIIDVVWLKECFQFRRLVIEDDFLVQPTNEQNQNDIKSLIRNPQDSRMFSMSRRSMIDPLGKSIGFGSNFDGLSNNKMISNISKSSFAPNQNQNINVSPHAENSKKSTSVNLVSHDIKDCKESMNINENNTKENNFKVMNNSGKLSESKEINDSKSKTESKSKGKKSPATKISSYIFKHIQFYFDNTEDLASYKKKVSENAGNLVKHYNVFEELFYVMPDGEESVAIMNKINKNKHRIKFVSPRWIDYCLAKKCVIKDFVDLQLVHLIPFHSKMPLEEFQNKTIFAAGYAPREKSIIHEILQIFGAKIEYDK